jgi:hypothetical protein
VLLGGVKVTMGEKMKIGIIWANDGKWDSEWIFIVPPILVEF